jgi:hypothetical protein
LNTKRTSRKKTRSEQANTNKAEMSKAEQRREEMRREENRREERVTDRGGGYTCQKFCLLLDSVTVLHHDAILSFGLARTG